MPKIALMYSEDSLKGVYWYIGAGGVYFYLADTAGTIVAPPLFLLRIWFVLSSYHVRICFVFSVFCIFNFRPVIETNKI